MQLIKQLEAQGYTKISICDEYALKANFRKMLFEHNKEKLNNTPFTDKEFYIYLIPFIAIKGLEKLLKRWK